VTNETARGLTDAVWRASTAPGGETAALRPWFPTRPDCGTGAFALRTRQGKAGRRSARPIPMHGLLSLRATATLEGIRKPEGQGFGGARESSETCLTSDRCPTAGRPAAPLGEGHRNLSAEPLPFAAADTGSWWRRTGYPLPTLSLQVRPNTAIPPTQVVHRQKLTRNVGS
jgi:hypothetical protein